MKRIPVTILLTALLTGLCLFFDTCYNSQKCKPDKQLFIKQHTLIVIDKAEGETSRLFKEQSDSLEKKLMQTQQMLRISKAKFNQLQLAVIKLKKDSAEMITAEQLKDSIEAQQKLFTIMVDSTRMLYQNNVNTLNDLVATKESETEACKCSYIQLQFIANENLERERTLTADLQRAYKQQCKELRQQKLLSGGLVLLSGIVTTFYSNTTK